MQKRALIVAATLAALAAPAASQPSEVFLKVGFPGGGGFDLMGRLVARHLGHFLDGGPEIIVQNAPGAGSLSLAMALQNTEPKDGSVIGLIHSTILTAPLLNPGISPEFNARDLRVIGSVSQDISVCYTGLNSGIDTLEAFLNEEFLVAASGKASRTYGFPASIRNALGTSFRIVTGFDGGGQIDAAIMSGEIQARCGNTLPAMQATGIDESVQILLQMGFQQHEDLAEVPHLLDLVEDESDRQAITLVFADLNILHALLLPAGTPDEMVERYRNAFDRMVADPEFIADAARIGREVLPV